MAPDILRTILYYPTIRITDPLWIRRNILYWDEISSIIPRELFNWSLEGQDSREIRMLHNRGIFYPTFPGEAFISQISKESFKEEIVFLHQAGVIRKKIYRNIDTEDSIGIHFQKIPEELIQYFINNDLAYQGGSDHWFFMHEETAYVYMSLLAKYLSNENTSQTKVISPGTGETKYASLLLSPLKNETAIDGISIAFNNLLPVPGVDVPLERILSFKEDHEDDLKAFRKKIYELHNITKNQVTSINELNDAMGQFSDDLISERAKLSKSLTNQDYSLIFQSVTSILGTTLALSNIFSENPSLLLTSGALVYGALSINNFLIASRNSKQDKLNENSFSYIYHAEKEGIVPPLE